MKEEFELKLIAEMSETKKLFLKIKIKWFEAKNGEKMRRGLKKSRRIFN